MAAVVLYHLFPTPMFRERVKIFTTGTGRSYLQKLIYSNNGGGGGGGPLIC